MDRNRRITLFLFLILVIIYTMLQLTSCTSHRMNKPVDYSYTQDSRDSLIARLHHYEGKHKEPTVTNAKSERVLEISTFILISLILFLLQ